MYAPMRLERINLEFQKYVFSVGAWYLNNIFLIFKIYIGSLSDFS